MDRPQSEGKSSKFSSTTSINLLHILCLIIIFITLKQINLNAVNSSILEFFINFPLDFRHTAKSFTIILCLIAFSFYSFYELYWKRRFLPPGPVPWLVAGNMPQVLLHGASNIDLLLQKWNKYYGGIFTFWMGPIPMVMVSDVDLLKKYFVRNGDVFSGRWQNFITHMFMDGHNGIIQIQGDKWREQRRFSLHVLRDFGFGRTAMEEKIKFEVRALITHLNTKFNSSKNTTEAFDVSKPVAVCIANIINSILFSRTYAHDDPSFIRVQQMLDEQSSLVVKPIMGLYLCLPWTVNLPLLGNAWRQLKQIRNDFWAFLEGHISEHLTEFNNKSQDLINSSDFIFAYLNEMERRKIKNEENGKEGDLGYFSEKQLKMLLLDLFFAGSETTVTTTKWGLILLILHPQVQERCFDEINTKLGQNEPELKDRNKLVYLSATICEIQRIANILPINLLRTCLEDIQVDNFHFKAGTMVLPQISITMNDSTYFYQPEKFNPERFIEINKFGELMLKKVDAFLPFSIGKRQCLGESLARAELFFIFAYLIKNFKFLPEGEGLLPSNKRIYGLTCAPQPFKCRLIARS